MDTDRHGRIRMDMDGRTRTRSDTDGEIPTYGRTRHTEYGRTWTDTDSDADADTDTERTVIERRELRENCYVFFLNFFVPLNIHRYEGNGFCNNNSYHEPKKRFFP